MEEIMENLLEKILTLKHGCEIVEEYIKVFPRLSLEEIRQMVKEHCEKAYQLMLQIEGYSTELMIEFEGKKRSADSYITQKVYLEAIYNNLLKNCEV